MPRKSFFLTSLAALLIASSCTQEPIDWDTSPLASSGELLSITDWSAIGSLTQGQYGAATSGNWGRSVAVDGRGWLHATWQQRDSDTTGAAHIVYRRSRSGGFGWDPPVFLSPSHRGTSIPKIAVAGNEVTVVWQGHHEALLVPGTPIDARVYARRSSNAGTSFNSLIRVSDHAAGVSAKFPSVAAVAGEAHVVWVRGEDVVHSKYDDSEVAYAIVRDTGTTPSILISEDDTIPSWTPHIALGTQDNGATSVHIGWVDEKDHRDLAGNPINCRDNGGACIEEEYYRRSIDGGMNFEPEKRMTLDWDPNDAAPDYSNQASSWAPSLSVDGDDVHFVYFDRADGTFDVIHRVSRNHGKDFEPEQVLTAALSSLGFDEAWRPSVSALDDNVHIAFWAESLTAEGTEIVYLRSRDGGVSFSDLLTISDAPLSQSTMTSVAALPDGTAVVIWHDDVSGVQQVKLRREVP